MSPAMTDRADTLAGVNLGALLEQLTGIEGRAESWPCPDPTHEQTGATPPVSLAADPRGYEFGRCHGCGWTGTAVDALMVARGIGAAEAFAELREGVNSEAPARPLASRRAKPNREFIPPAPEELARIHQPI